MPRLSALVLLAPVPLALVPLALIPLAIPMPSSAHPLPQPTNAVALSALGSRQQAYFAQRLAVTALRIERRQRARILSRGQAAFMQQDLVRVNDGIGMILRRCIALSADEERSYRAMLDRVDNRLLHAEAKSVVRLAS